MKASEIKPDPELIKIKAPGFNMRALFNGSPSYSENKFKSEANKKNKFLFIDKQGKLINHLNNL